MGRRRVARAGVLLIASAVALTCLGGGAEAKKKKRKQPRPVAAVATAVGSGPGTIVSATAKCPRGTRATGGGYHETQPSVTSQGIVFESHKVGQNAWTASTQIRTLGPPPYPAQELVVTVYCLKKLPVTTQVSATSPLGPSQTTSGAFVACPPGARRFPISGGFSTSPPVSGGDVKQVVVGNGSFGGSMWGVQVFTGATPGVATAYADCTPNRAYRDLDNTDGPSAANPTVGTTSNDSSPCAFLKGNRVIGLNGGFRQSGLSTSSGGSLFLVFRSEAGPITKKSSEYAWNASGFHLGGFAPTPVQLESFTECVLQNKHPTGKKKKKKK